MYYCLIWALDVLVALCVYMYIHKIIIVSVVFEKWCRLCYALNEKNCRKLLYFVCLIEKYNIYFLLKFVFVISFVLLSLWGKNIWFQTVILKLYVHKFLIGRSSWMPVKIWITLNICLSAILHSAKRWWKCWK